jgi:hypothetical protein
MQVANANYLVGVRLPEKHRFVGEWHEIQEPSIQATVEFSYQALEAKPPYFWLNWKVADDPVVVPLPRTLRACGFVSSHGLGGAVCGPPPAAVSRDEHPALRERREQEAVRKWLARTAETVEELIRAQVKARLREALDVEWPQGLEAVVRFVKIRP